MKRFLLVTAGLLTITVVAVGVMHAAQPKLTWSPTGIYAGITNTTTVTKTVTFTSDQALQNVTIEAVPEIAPFVKIQPKTFAQVSIGQPQTVQLTFSAPAASKYGAYDGTIHLRMNNATVPQTLKTSVTFAVVPLPPDPGEAGKVTLPGIDSDGDGVRDDVERVIGFLDISGQQRSALLSLAKAMQRTITVNAPKATVIQEIQTELMAGRCGSYLLGQKFTPLVNAVRVAALNTRARLTAYLHADAQFSGQTTLGMPEGLAACQILP